MNYRTELMQAILQSPRAQKIIDYVSPIYGNSYVALWIYEAIGYVMGSIYDMGDNLRYETNPATATILLDYWEDHYGIPRDTRLTAEQRRMRIIVKAQNRGPCNLYRLEMAISSALGGVPVEITENTAKNTFLVNIREYVEDITPAVAVLERMKPAHLIYEIRMALQTVSEADIKIAIALTHSEHYKMEVFQ